MSFGRWSAPALLILLFAAPASVDAACDRESLFVLRHDYAGQPGAAGLAVGDFDRDGRSDLAIVHRASRMTEIWHGQPDGGFVMASELNHGVFPTRPAVGDFNGDQWLDLGILDEYGQIFVLRGTSGGLVLNNVVTVPGRPTDLAAGELNGDGRTDLVVTNSANGTLVALLTGPTPFSFSPHTLSTDGTDRSHPFAIVAADLNADGLTDLAVGKSNDGQVAVFLSAGGGAFEPVRVYPAAIGASLVAGDADDDGGLDLVFGHANGFGYLRNLLDSGRPTGRFHPVAVNHADPGGDFRAVRVMDHTGDGVSDLVVFSAARRAIGVLVGIDSDQGTRYGVPEWCPIGVAPGHAHLEDRSGDGVEDAVVIAPGDARVRVLVAQCTEIRTAPRPPDLDPPASASEIHMPFPIPPDPGPRPSSPSWPEAGRPICVAPGDQTELSATNDHAHGVYLAWRDRRSGSSDIYATRLGPDGWPRPGWNPDGNLVCDAPGEQYSPRVFCDGRGLVWIAWIDERDGAPALHVQRLTASGAARPGWPALGRRVSAVSGTTSTGVWSDLVDGLIATWAEPGSAPARYRRLHLAPDGSVWPPGAPDGGDVVFTGISWHEECSHSSRSLVSIFPIWPAATVSSWVWSWMSCPHVECSNCIGATTQGIAIDHESGGRTFFAEHHSSNWHRPHDDERGGIFLTTQYSWIQRVGAPDHPTWSRLLPIPIDQVERLGESYLVLGRTSGDSVESLMRILGDGSNAAGWPDAGVRACAECSYATPRARARTAHDGSEGAFLVWEDRAGLRANWFRHDGAHGWGPLGRVIARTPGPLVVGGVVGNGKGDAIVSWQDSRNGDADLWAYRISFDSPPLPAKASRGTTAGLQAAGGAAEAALRFEDPPRNPALGAVEVRFVLPRGGRVAAALLDASGRSVASRTADLPGGRHHLELAGPGALAPGIYIVRVESAGRVITRRFAVIR